MTIQRILIWNDKTHSHYYDVIMGTMAYQITSLTIVYSTVYSDADQRKHQSSASLAFVRGIHRSPVNSPHKWPVTRKMFPFDDVIMVLTHKNALSGESIRYHFLDFTTEDMSSKWNLFGLFICWDFVARPSWQMTPYGDTNLGQYWLM